VVPIDTAVSASDENVEPFALESIGLIWALPSRTEDGTSALRFVAVGEGGVRRVLGEIPSPFKVHQFRAAPLGREILVSGLVVSDSGYAASLLLRVSVHCDARITAP
jgi:hypothetical protein